MIKGEYVPCNTSRCISCQQIIATTYESIQTKEKFNIYYKIYCKSKYVIYLLECLLCKILNDGKAEAPFHIRLNNHRKDIKKTSHYRSMQTLTTGTMSSLSVENSH